jgi:integrase/recombinase XerD
MPGLFLSADRLTFVEYRDLRQGWISFLFKHVLNKKWDWGSIVKPKRIQSLPDVITYDQVAQLLTATREQRYQSYFLCTYSMGLRLTESLGLEVDDIDAEQMRVHVRLGKGRKDRNVILPQKTLIILRRYWATHRHPRYIFPAGQSATERFRAVKTMSKSGVQRTIRLIARDAKIRTRVTTHTLNWFQMMAPRSALAIEKVEREPERLGQ